MKTTKHQNPIHLVTTISVYLGLVLVGASPQVIAQANFSGEVQSRIFEFTSKTNTVLSKLKLRQETVQDEIVSFPASSPAVFKPFRCDSSAASAARRAVGDKPIHDNDQVFVVSMLARASI
jgi:hypothetical protein